MSKMATGRVIRPVAFVLGRRMKIDVVVLPGLLKEGEVGGRAVVVFDVLRATTSMTAALWAGAREIRVFGSLEAARGARGGWGDRRWGWGGGGGGGGRLCVWGGGGGGGEGGGGGWAEMGKGGREREKEFSFSKIYFFSR